MNGLLDLLPKNNTPALVQVLCVVYCGKTCDYLLAIA